MQWPFQASCSGRTDGTAASNIDNAAFNPSIPRRNSAMKRLLILSVASLVSGFALAEYPEKPITLIVPFTAGGPTDKVARDLGEALRKPLGGQPIIVENVGGAGGTLGAGKTAKAAPDGYTLLLHPRHVNLAGAVPKPSVQDTGRFRVPRHGQRSPDDADRQTWPARQQLCRAGRVAGSEQGQGQPGECRPGSRLAPVRVAV